MGSHYKFEPYTYAKRTSDGRPKSTKTSYIRARQNVERYWMLVWMLTHRAMSHTRA